MNYYYYYYQILIFTIILLWSPKFLRISAVEYLIDVWPKPRSTHWHNRQAIKLSGEFKISGSTRHSYLAAAVLRYRNQIVNESHRPFIPPNLTLVSFPQLETLKITVSDFVAALAHGVDESYTLKIPCTGKPAALSARTQWGAMRGLETFSQLVYLAPQRAVACGVNISDAPLFPHRGVLLDTSRNYYDVKDLLRLIDALSMNKMNVFHWHITDSQSFPLQLKSEPGLAANGAYGKEMLYTEDDVRRLVKYGMERGVRIVPEIDMPAHTGSWSKAYPDIVTCADLFWWPAGSKWEDRLASEPGTGQLNPLIPKTYKVVKNVIHDVTTMFPDELFHAGNDEINPNCWKTDPTIQNYLSKNKTLSQVLEKFVASTLPYILSMNRTVVYWEDVLLDSEIKVGPTFLPPENVILQSWNDGPNNTKRIVSSGYRAIVSSADFYYLDCGHGGFLGNDSQYDQASGLDQGNGGSWCGPFKTWQTIYNYDITYGLSEEEARRVVGGEVALWSEQADRVVMDSRIWPRAAAAAEAWWSGNRDRKGRKRFAEATDRLTDWRYRMVEREIWAEPIQPLWCRKNPGMCNTVQSS